MECKCTCPQVDNGMCICGSPINKVEQENWKAYQEILNKLEKCSPKDWDWTNDSGYCDVFNFNTKINY